jgi:hypothetical protein
MTGVLDVLAPSALLPPGVKTGTELLLNRSFFTGRDIVRQEEQGRPAAEQFRPGTSTISRALGNLLGWSPIKLDYFFGSSFGSLGRDVIHAADAADPNAPDIPPENAMFLRRGIKRADITSQTTQTFWRWPAANGEYVGAKSAYDQAIKIIATRMPRISCSASQQPAPMLRCKAGPIRTASRLSGPMRKRCTH